MDRQWVACYACMYKYCAVFKKAFPLQWCPETKEKQTETPRQESKAPSAAVSCQTEAHRNAAANNEYGVKPAKKRRKGRKTQVFWYSLKTRSPLAKRDISISMYIKPTNRGIYSGHSVPLGGFFWPKLKNRIWRMGEKWGKEGKGEKGKNTGVRVIFTIKW